MVIIRKAYWPDEKKERSEKMGVFWDAMPSPKTWRRDNPKRNVSEAPSFWSAAQRYYVMISAA